MDEARLNRLREELEKARKKRDDWSLVPDTIKCTLSILYKHFIIFRISLRCQARRWEKQDTVILHHPGKSLHVVGM